MARVRTPPPEALALDPSARPIEWAGFSQGWLVRTPPPEALALDHSAGPIEWAGFSQGWLVRTPPPEALALDPSARPIEWAGLSQGWLGVTELPLSPQHQTEVRVCEGEIRIEPQCFQVCGPGVRQPIQRS